MRSSKSNAKWRTYSPLVYRGCLYSDGYVSMTFHQNCAPVHQCLEHRWKNRSVAPLQICQHKQIIFETGQLSQMQGQLTIESDNLVRRLALEPARSRTLGLHPFSSPLLVNRLSTLSLAIPQLVPESLLQPLYDRRKQLSNTSVARLHWSAQKAMLLTYCTSAIGILFSWGGSVGPLVLVSEGTALGLGLLSVLGSLAVGQRMWHAAQKRFWRDFDRVTRMLEGELKVSASPAQTSCILLIISKRLSLLSNRMSLQNR